MNIEELQELAPTKTTQVKRSCGTRQGRTIDHRARLFSVPKKAGVMVNNYFQQSRELAEHLRQQGFESESRALVDAIEAGSTGTEIQMALRHHLRTISNDARLEADARAIAKQIAETITQVLGM